MKPTVQIMLSAALFLFCSKSFAVKEYTCRCADKIFSKDRLAIGDDIKDAEKRFSDLYCQRFGKVVGEAGADVTPNAPAKCREVKVPTATANPGEPDGDADATSQH